MAKPPTPYYDAIKITGTTFKFWVWFDTLPPEGRRALNDVGNGQEMVELFHAWIARHPPHPLTGKATRVLNVGP